MYQNHCWLEVKTTALSKYNMLTIDQIFSVEIAKFMFQFKSKKLPVIFDNSFNLIKDASNNAIKSAIKNNFCLPLYKTRRGQKSIKYLGVKLWNSIPEKMRDLTFPKFKKAYRSFLQENYNSL